MGKEYLFASESVTEGHPDKLCDRISDAVLDRVLSVDRESRVACEVFATRGLVMVAGEFRVNREKRGSIGIEEITRDVIRKAGYTEPDYGFCCDTAGIILSVNSQSREIAKGVDTGGAGDQGMMFGYASDETPELMPLPIMLAHKLARRLAEVRKKKIVKYLRPDGKTQVTVRYENGHPKSVESVVLSAQHDEGISKKRIESDLVEFVIEEVIPAGLRAKNMKIFINPTGSFLLGGPQADTGLTGRKIIVDTYGGVGSHGGGCFSGKDPSKVDRSACYMARYLAKNIVASGKAKKCSIQLAYVIGRKDPVSVCVHTGSDSADIKIAESIKKHFDLSPFGIIEKLDLKRPIYENTSVYGHFGRDDEGFGWEKLDSVDVFK